MSDLLNQEQIAAAVGVTNITINAWQKKGMPHYAAPNGRIKRYKLFEVLEWMKRNSKSTYKVSKGIKNEG